MKILKLNLLLFFLLCFQQNIFAKEVNGSVTAPKILEMVNSFRESHGLNPLKLNPIISSIAKNHTVKMAHHDIELGHSGFSGRAHTLMHNIPQTRNVAENVAFHDLDNVKRLVNLWLNSPGHKKNILGNYNFTGIDVEKDDNGRVYATQIFINSKRNG